MFHRSFIKIYVLHCITVTSLLDTDNNNLNWKKFTFNCVYKITDHSYFKKSLQNSFLNMSSS